MILICSVCNKIILGLHFCTRLFLPFPSEVVFVLTKKQKQKNRKTFETRFLSILPFYFVIQFFFNLDAKALIHHSKTKFWRSTIFYFGVGVIVFKAIFNNISVILWWSVLLVEETGVPGENHQPVVSHWQTLSHNVVSSTPRYFGSKILNNV